MKKYILTLLICWATILNGKAQDFVYSQFYSNPLYLNPAFAGADPGVKVYSAYRNQWANVPSVFRSMQFAIDSDIRLFKDGAGVGAIVNHSIEGEGFLTNSQFGLVFSKGLRLIDNTKINGKSSTGKTKKLYLYFGTNLSYVQRSIDWSKFYFSDQLDAVNGVVRPSDFDFPTVNIKGFLDMTIGTMARLRYRRNVFALGHTVHHINAPNQALLGPVSSLPRRFNTHFTYTRPLGAAKIIDPVVISVPVIVDFQARQRTINIGAMVTKNVFYGGIWLRNRVNQADATIFTVGFRQGIPKLGLGLQFGYSYDVTVSRLRYATSGSNEISLRLSFGSIYSDTKYNSPADKKRKAKRQIQCSEFKDDIQLKNPTFF